MFGKSASTESPQSAEQVNAQPSPKDYAVPRKQDRQHTFLSKDAKLTGDIVSTGDVTVEGALDGKIECRSLTLSGEPSISGSVQAETVHVCGGFEGELHARKVILAKTARMSGNIFQESLEIHSGAKFEGQVCRRRSQPDNGAQAPLTVIHETHELEQSRPESPVPCDH